MKRKGEDEGKGKGEGKGEGKEKGQSRRRVNIARIAPPRTITHDLVAGIKSVAREMVYSNVSSGLRSIRYGGDLCMNIGGERGNGDLLIKRRIGRHSRNAQVFETVFRKNPKGGKFAVKSIPFTGFFSQTKMNAEFDIYEQATDRVQKGLTQYFPIVYQSGFCGALELEPPRLEARRENYVEVVLWDRANNWKSIEYLVGMCVRTPLMRNTYLRRFQDVDVFTAFETLLAEYSSAVMKRKITLDVVDLNLNESIRGGYMAMELAWGDLEAFIKAGPDVYTKSEKIMDKLIEDTFTAIVHMQTYLGVRDESINSRYRGIYHSNLDLDNILIQLVRDSEATRKITPIPLITGFSQARELNEDNQFRDVARVIAQLFELKTFFPIGIQRKLTNVLFRPLSESNSFEVFEDYVESVVDAWSFYEPAEYSEEKKESVRNTPVITDPRKLEKDGYRVFRPSKGKMPVSQPRTGVCVSVGRKLDQYLA